jgi:hypothetical protein
MAEIVLLICLVPLALFGVVALYELWLMRDF